jgi:hypothetical protein
VEVDKKSPIYNQILEGMTFLKVSDDQIFIPQDTPPSSSFVSTDNTAAT